MLLALPRRVAVGSSAGGHGWGSLTTLHLSHPQAGVPRATPQGLPGDGLQVSLQRADAGTDPAGQRPHRPPGSLLRALLQQTVHHVSQP